MHYREFLKRLLPICLAVCCLSSQAQDLAQQRRTYRLAQLAMAAGQMQTFKQLQAQLSSYPLYPYLVFEELKRRLYSAPDAAIEGFIERYADTPLADVMRDYWLYRLYSEDRWQKFLEVYDGRAVTEYMCYDVRARIRAGRMDTVIEDAKRLWLVGYSQHRACDSLFAWLKQQEEFTSEWVWQRIELAMYAGNPGLAGYLAEQLNDQDRAWVTLWQQVYSNPQIILNEPALKGDELVAREILMHGALLLAERDVERGRTAWEQLKLDHAFEADERDYVDRSIALLAAYRHHPQADAWLNGLPASAQNDDVQTWRARTAMREGDWPTLTRAIGALDDTTDELLMWRYWQARALEGSGDRETAHQLYVTLARERDYYGFLAADRLDAPYSIVNAPLVNDPAAAGTLIEIPGVRRAYELLRVGDETNARREWNHALNGMPLEQKKLAAVLASAWGWHSDAISAVAAIGELDDLEVRFPTPYRDEVMQVARHHELDPALIYGIIRRESAFAARAKSSSGALGLMQLMPGTAALVAQHLDLPAPSASDLLNPTSNINFGSAYLNEMLTRFGGNQALAAAAYNAGPHRVERWLPARGSVSADAWVEAIPLYETRDYVKAVLAYSAVYESKLGARNITPLAQRMEPIPLADRDYAHR